MANIRMQSIKIEMEADDMLTTAADMLEDAFYEAVSRLVQESGGTPEDEQDVLLSKFFTMRFDETVNGGIAVTLSCSEKRV